MNISVIICAYTEDRWATLASGIAGVQQQSVQPHEIVIVIDNNPALAARVRNHFPDVHVIDHDGPRGLNHARNAGVAASSGEIVAFLDDDAIPEQDWLEKLVPSYSDQNVLGVGGKVIPAWAAGCPSWFPAEFNWTVGCDYRGMPETTSLVRNFIGCNMSFRREVFVAVGGFSSRLGRIGTYPLGCEETEFCIRIQKNQPACLLYEPHAQVHHVIASWRGRWRYFFRRCYMEGCSKAVVTKLTGAGDGLSSERSYTMRTLPLGVLRGIADSIFHADPSGLMRASAIIAGLSCTVAGYVVGSFKDYHANQMAVSTSA